MHENNGHKLAKAVSERWSALRRSMIFRDWLNPDTVGFGPEAVNQPVTLARSSRLGLRLLVTASGKAAQPFSRAHNSE
mgnify:CR=1 FL=1